MTSPFNSTFTIDEISEDNVIGETEQVSEFEEMLSKYTRTYKKVIQDQQNSLQSVTDELHNVKKQLIERNAENQGLNEIIKVKESELEKHKTENTQLQSEIRQLKQDVIVGKQQFTALESSYDTTLSEMQFKLEQITRKKEEVESKYADLLKKHEESQSCLKTQQEQIQAGHAALQQVQSELEHALNEQLKNTSQLEHYETKLKELEAKLVEKDNLLSQCRTEKLDMEEQKNKIIQEQSFKISEIERIFGQPINRVQANANARQIQPPNAKSNDGTQRSNTAQQRVTFVKPQSTRISQLQEKQTKPATDRKHMEQQELKTPSAQPPPLQQQQRWQQRTYFTNGRRRRISPQILAENNFSSDDSDSDWHAKLPPLNDTTFASDMERRSVNAPPDVYIAETSESDCRFDQIKRSKS